MDTLSSEAINMLFQHQLKVWDMAHKNYVALSNVKEKNFVVGNAHYKVQFNPARIVSSAAKVDRESLQKRACFLCEANRPKEQEGIRWRDYTIILNPFPIFPRHLTIPTNTHTAQRIVSRIGDMMALAFEIKDYVIFYNGPKCGASAPDHMHFQAGQKGLMPYPSDLKYANVIDVKDIAGATLRVAKDLGRVAYLIQSTKIEAGVKLFNELYSKLPVPENEDEPMLNILCWWTDEDCWTMSIFPRKKHRPDCYYAEGEANCLISPASVDMGGVFITPLEKDFDKISGETIQKILNEVCLSEKTAEKLVND